MKTNNKINTICIINLFFGDDKIFKSEVDPKKKIEIKNKVKIKSLTPKIKIIGNNKNNPPVNGIGLFKNS